MSEKTGEREGRIVKRSKSAIINAGSRISRGLRSLSRNVPQLPKVFRARGKKKDTKAKKRASKIKQKSKAAKARKAAPPISPELKKALSGDFAIWIGQNFPSALCLSHTIAKKALTKLSNKLDAEAKVTKEIKALLLETKEKYAALVKARDLLKEELGVDRFNAALTKVLEPEMEAKRDFELAIKLLKALNPKAIFYAGVDRNLENHLQHENLPYQSLTAQDLLAFEDTVETESKNVYEELQNQYASSTLLIKTNGDVSKPETLVFNQTENLESLCFNEEYEVVETTPQAKTLKKVITEVTSALPVVFIGQGLLDAQAITQLLKLLKKEANAKKLAEEEARLEKENSKETPKEEGETVEEGEPKEVKKEETNAKADVDAEVEESFKHVALVHAASGNHPRPDMREVGVSYTVYHPDKEHTQIEEFMAAMTSVRSTIPEKIETSAISEAATSSNLKSFLKNLTVKEEEASSISLFANSVLDLPLCQKVNEEGNRASVFMNKLTSTVSLNTLVNEEAQVETNSKPSKEEPKVINVKISKEAAVVKVLLPLSALKSFTDAASSDTLTKVERVVEALVDSQGKLEVRFVDIADSPTDFEILAIGTSSGIGELCLAHSVSSDKWKFDVSFFEVNTNLAEEKTLLFERMWASASSTVESLKLLESSVSQARDIVSGVSKKDIVKGKKKRDRLKFFSKKDDSKEAKKTEKGGIIRKVVRSLSIKKNKDKDVAPVADIQKTPVENEEEKKQVEAATEEVTETVEEKAQVIDELKKTSEVIEAAPMKEEVKEPKKKGKFLSGWGKGKAKAEKAEKAKAEATAAVVATEA